MKQIEVCERLMDHCFVPVERDGRLVMERRPKYHAKVVGSNEWACGESREEAIGQLILCHPEVFGIKIEYLEGKLPR